MDSHSFGNHIIVAHFGNINPTIYVDRLEAKKYEVTVSATEDVKNANIKTRDEITHDPSNRRANQLAQEISNDRKLKKSTKQCYEIWAF